MSGCTCPGEQCWADGPTSALWPICRHVSGNRWTLRRLDGSETPLDVPKRTEAQRARSKRNVDHPLPPEDHKRHGQTDALR